MSSSSQSIIFDNFLKREFRMRMSRRLSAYSKPLGVGLIIFLIYYLTSEPTTAVSYFLKAYFKTKELRSKFSRIDNIFGIVIISAQF